MLVLGGCTAPACAPGIVAELYFGRAAPVTEAAWQAFLAESVTPRFPDGLTVLDGHGQWRRRDTGAIVAEPSSVLVVAADRSPEVVAKLEAIRAEYRTRFAQESVGLVITQACVAF